MTLINRTIKQSQLPRQPGESGWVAMLPPRTPVAQLKDRITADIVIIGAGFAGLSAARRLRQLDNTLRIVILEAGVIGDGPAGRNSGFIIDLPHEVSSEDYGGNALQKSRDHVALQRRAVSFAVSLAEEQGWSKSVLDLSGRYNLALTPAGDKHISEYSAQLDQLGEEYRILDRSTTMEITGSSAFSSGLYMPGTAIIQPAAYIRSLADVVAASVSLFENSPAMTLETNGKGWCVKTPTGAVETAKVILANNGYAEQFGFFRHQILPVYTYASLTKKFDPKRLGGLRTWAATPASPMGTTLRRIADSGGDRLLVRSRYTYNPDMNVSNETLRRAGLQHDKKFAYRFPALTDVEMEYRWGGVMALTWNSVPAYGALDTGLFAACGCNGLGASNATASGLAIAEEIMGVESDLTRIYHSFVKPKTLPPQPITYVGVKSTLAFREWRAGVE